MQRPLTLGQRNECLVLLLRPLPTEEIVIAACGEIRVFVANARPRVVDGASARFRIKKHTNTAVDLVFLMSKNNFPFTRFREALRRNLGIEIKVLRQLLDVAFVDDDPFVAAAVRRTLRAVVSSHARSSVREWTEIRKQRSATRDKGTCSLVPDR